MMDMTTTTETAGPILYARRALAYVHDATCSNHRYEHSFAGCITTRMLASTAWVATIAHLQAHPRDAATARGLLHDAVCINGAECYDRAVHAQRQARHVAALRKFLASSEHA